MVENSGTRVMKRHAGLAKCRSMLAEEKEANVDDAFGSYIENMAMLVKEMWHYLESSKVTCFEFAKMMHHMYNVNA